MTSTILAARAEEMPRVSFAEPHGGIGLGRVSLEDGEAEVYVSAHNGTYRRLVGVEHWTADGGMAYLDGNLEGLR